MPNDPANDRYNPPSTSTVDFETFVYRDLEDNEVFWMSNNQKDVFPHRKINDNLAVNLKARQNVNMNPSSKVYQKV